MEFACINLSFFFFLISISRAATDVAVKRIPTSELSISSVYVVEGVTMGMALLLYNATVTTGKVVTSWPAEIQVMDVTMCYH